MNILNHLKTLALISLVGLCPLTEADEPIIVPKEKAMAAKRDLLDKISPAGEARVKYSVDTRAARVWCWSSSTHRSFRFGRFRVLWLRDSAGSSFQ